jgi:putative oxidoreductase
MQQLKNIPAYLLALVYLVFGSNFFLKFIDMPPMEGNAGAFIGVLYSTGFLAFVKVLEIVLGLLLVLPATRRLALVLIAPISVNILLFELFIAHQPGIGILLVLLNGFAIYQNRKSYMPIVSAA